MSNDIALTPVGITSKPHTSSKPSHLIVFEDVAKGKVKKFITLDRPEGNGHLIQAKGVLTDLKEEEVQLTYQEVLTSSPRESIMELMIPCSRIFYIRSLVFKAK
jgi:hypothetical protein